jgi:hypothetical protein
MRNTHNKQSPIFSTFLRITMPAALIIFLMISGGKAQTNLLNPLTPFQQGTQWGLKNKVSAAVLYQAKYDSVVMLSDTVAQVWLKGKTGCITSQAEIIPCSYKIISVGKSNPELFTVTNDTAFGVFSIYGKAIAACKYKEITIDKNGIIYKLNSKKGMFDKTGKAIIPCDYEAIFDFYDSLALVRKNNKYGFVNITGKEVIPCEYEKVFWNKKKFNYFPGGKALVQKNGKYGIIDRTGAVIVDCQYDWEFYLPLLSNYSRVIQNDKKGLIDKKGKQILPCVYDDVRWENDTTRNCNPAEISGKQLFTVKSNDKWGIVDEFNNVIVPIKYDDIGNFSCGYAAANLYGKWGFIDPKDSTMIPFDYDYCGEFRNGLAVASKSVFDAKDSKLKIKSGLIDKKGIPVLPLEYTVSYLADESVYIFSTDDGKVGAADSNGIVMIKPELKISTFWTSWKTDGMIKVYDTETKKYGYYSNAGKLVIPIKYDDGGFFSENLVAMKKDLKWGYLNSLGKEVIPFEYNEAGTFSDGMALIKTEKLYGYIDKNGKEIIPQQYTEAGNFSSGYAKVMMNQNSGLIDKKGKIIIPIMQENILYNNDLLSYFTENLTLVQRNDSFGYYDTTGFPVIPCKFYWADFFSCGKAVVIDSSGKYHYIDKTGHCAFADGFDKAYSFYKDLAIVKDGKTYKMINSSGTVITTLPYDEVKAYIDGPAAVKQGKLWGFIDEKGKLILPLKYEKASSFRNGEAQVDIDGSTCRINIKGDIIGLGTK